MRDLGKISLGGATAIAINTGIQYFVVGAPFKKATDSKLVAKDFIALGLELGVAGAAYAIIGPAPALIGAIEALTFLGLRLAGVGSPVVVNEPKVEEPKLVPSKVVPSTVGPTVPTSTAARPEAPDASLPEDFSGSEDFGNPEDFGNREDFGNPEDLAGTGQRRGYSQHSTKFIR